MAIARKTQTTQDYLDDPTDFAPTPLPYVDPPQPWTPDPALPSAHNTGVVGPSLPSVPTRTDYTPIAGWEQTKLNDPAKHNTKYDFGRAAQDFQGGYGRGNLQGLVDFYNQSYGGKAKVQGDDAIDFGEAYGPVDVLNGHGDTLQWYVNDPNAQPTRGGAAPQAFADAGLPSWLTDFMGGSGKRANTATAIEGARMPYEIARKSQLNNARGDLANRGLLSEPGHQQGPEVSALQRIEEGLAPAYTGAISDRLQQEDQNDIQRTQVLGNIALGYLDQNRLWNQFINTFGLDRDRLNYDIQHGNIDQYLGLLQLYLQGAGQAADGYV